MPDQYVARDSDTGVEVAVTGDFPEDPEDRVRIARACTLFTRLISTLLATENATERRERFRAVEMQLEIADAVIRHDLEEVQRLIRETLHTMGVTDDQLHEIEGELRRQFEQFGGGEFPPTEEPPGDEG